MLIIIIILLIVVFVLYQYGLRKRRDIYRSKKKILDRLQRRNEDK